MTSYKLQKLDDDTLIINWKSKDNYIISVLCLCAVIFFLGLGIYNVYMVDYDYEDDERIIFWVIFYTITSMISILLSIIIPVKEQLKIKCLITDFFENNII